MKKTFPLPLIVRCSLFIIYCSLLTHAFAQWRQTPLSPERAIYALTATPSAGASGGILYAGTYGEGVYRSTDNGASWTQTVNGLYDYHVNALLTIGGIVFAGADNYGIFISRDSGAHWSQADSGMPFKTVYAFASDGGNLCAGAFDDESPTSIGALFLSRDTGRSWSNASAGFPVNTYIYALAASGGNIFAGVFNSTSTNYGVYITSDEGANWLAADSGLPADAYSVQALAATNNHVFAGFDGGGVYVTSDGGAYWTEANNGLTGIYVYALCAIGSNLFAGTTGGVFLTTDDGNSWRAVNDGLSDSSVYSLCINGGYIFTGTVDSGVYRRPLSDFGISQVIESHEASPQFSLLQNYPNPFSSTTTISLNADASGAASLKIYDALGRQVADLTKQIGNTQILFDGSSLPAGVYICHAQAGRTIQQIIMVLMK